MGQAWQWIMNYKFLLISSRSLITWRQNVLFRCHATRRRSYEGPFDKSTVAFLPPSLKDWDERNGQSRNMHKIYSRIITQISFYFSQFVLRWDVLHRRPPKLLQIIDNEVKTRHQEEAFGGCLWSSRYSPFSCKSSSSSSFHSLWFSAMAANSTIDGIPIYLQLLLHQFSSVGLMSAIQ